MEDEYDEYDMPISNPVPPPPNKQRNEKCGRRSGTSEFICPLLHFWKMVMDTPRRPSGGEKQRAVSIIYRDCAKERRED